MRLCWGGRGMGLCWGAWGCAGGGGEWGCAGGHGAVAVLGVGGFAQGLGIYLFAFGGAWGGGGVGMTPWCVVLVCSWRRLLADRHSLPFPWTLSHYRQWCPSASHPPVSFLFLLALFSPLCFPFLSLGLSLHGPWCGLASHRSFPLLSLGQLCQRSPRTCPVSLLCVESTQRKATAFAVGQVHSSSHPKPALRYLSPTAAGGPWDVHLRVLFPQRGHITTSCLQIPVLSPPFGERIT